MHVRIVYILHNTQCTLFTYCTHHPEGKLSTLGADYTHSPEFTVSTLCTGCTIFLELNSVCIYGWYTSSRKHIVSCVRIVHNLQKTQCTYAPKCKVCTPCIDRRHPPEDTAYACSHCTDHPKYAVYTA